jgi:energy-coupling factor transport system ATP-binding protein
LAALAQERAVLVVTHEPELFRGVIDGGWRLEAGQLSELRTMPSHRNGEP